MPLYEYRCLKCKRHAEKIERLNGPYLKKCPYCGGEVEPVITAPAIQFKGTGWYVTDYARKTSGGDTAKTSKAESKSEAPAKETSKEGKKTAPVSSEK